MHCGASSGGIGAASPVPSLGHSDHPSLDRPTLIFHLSSLSSPPRPLVLSPLGLSDCVGRAEGIPGMPVSKTGNTLPCSEQCCSSLILTSQLGKHQRSRRAPPTQITTFASGRSGKAIKSQNLHRHKSVLLLHFHALITKILRSRITNKLSSLHPLQATHSSLISILEST